jgi:hypothetical protein
MRSKLVWALLVGVVGIAVYAGTVLARPPAETNAASGIHVQHAVQDEAGLKAELAQVRRATARFHDLDAALDAGYELGWVNGSGQRIITGCVSHPTAGAMGYHYFNAGLMADLTTDALQPEALVYARREDGSLKLAAVEWVVRGPNSNPPGVSEQPSVLGMGMHILNPVVGFWLMHAWVWKPNPAGMFEDWNPEVACP